MPKKWLNIYKNKRNTLKWMLFSFHWRELISKTLYQQIEDRSYYVKLSIQKVIYSRILDYFELILFPYIENKYLKNHFKPIAVSLQDGLYFVWLDDSTQIHLQHNTLNLLIFSYSYKKHFLEGYFLTKWDVQQFRRLNDRLIKQLFSFITLE